MRCNWSADFQNWIALANYHCSKFRSKALVQNKNTWAEIPSVPSHQIAPGPEGEPITRPGYGPIVSIWQMDFTSLGHPHKPAENEKIGSFRYFQALTVFPVGLIWAQSRELYVNYS